MAEQFKKEILIDISLTNEAALETIQKANAAISQLDRSMKELEEQGKKNSKQYIAEKAAIDEYKQQIRLASKELRDNIQAQKQQGTSLDAMRAKLRDLTRTYDDLSKEERNAFGDYYVGEIRKLTNEIEALEEATGRHQRKVGSYEDAMKNFARTMTAGARGMNAMGMESGVAAAGLGKVSRAATLLSKNPIMVVMLAAVSLVNRLTKAFKESDEAMQSVHDVASAFTPVMDVLNGLVARMVDGISKIVGGFAKLMGGAKEASKEVRAVGDAENYMAAESVKSAAKAKVLDGIVHDTTKSYEQRNAALIELKGIVPGYHAALTKEGDLLNDNRSAIDEYVASMVKMARNQAVFDKMVDTARKKMESDNTYEKLQTDYLGYTKAVEQIRNGNKKAGEEFIKKLREAYSVAKGVDVGEVIRRQMDAAFVASQRAKDEIDALGDQLEITATAAKSSVANVSNTIEEDVLGNAEQLLMDAKQLAVKKVNETFDNIIANIREKYPEQTELIKRLETQRAVELANIYTGGVEKALDTAKKKYEQYVKDAKDEGVTWDKAAAVAASNEIATRMAEAAGIGELAVAQVKLDIANEKYDAAKNRLEELKALSEEEAKEQFGNMANFELAKQQETENFIRCTDMKKKAQDEFNKKQKDEKAKTAELASMYMSAIGTVAGAFGDLFESMDEGSKQQQNAMLAVSMVEILANMGVGIATAVVEGIKLGWPACIPAIAAGIAAVVSGIATAISTVNKAKGQKYATGGYVEGPGTGTSDSIPARLSNGEFVVNAKATKRNLPLLAAINGGMGSGGRRYATGGLVMPSTVATDTDTMMVAMRAAVADVQPVVSVKEITRVQSRVEAKERLTRR